MAINNIREVINLLSSGALARFGFSSIFRGSPSSNPIGITMALSVTKLTHKICTGASGSGKPEINALSDTITSPRLVANRYVTMRLILA